MLTRLINALTPTRAPSALIVIGYLRTTKTTINILHLVPEDGSIERFGLTTNSSTTPFRHKGATEQAREQIGTVTLHAGDGESAAKFLEDVDTRVRKLWNDSLNSKSATEKQTQAQTDSDEVTRLVQDVLRPAALDAIHEREGRERSMNATQTFPVFILRIVRSKEGRILPAEPTSIS